MNKKEKFIATIQSNSALIYKAAALYTNTKQDREDLVQEIIYQLWRSYDSFENRSTESTWMYRVAMNVAIHHFKKAKKLLPTIPIDSEILNLKATNNNEFDER